MVRAHQAVLVQALANLLGNAVKFVRPDSHAAVRIVASARGCVVRIEVQDNGIGMADEARARVFNVFERLHGKMSVRVRALASRSSRKGSNA